MKEQESNQSLDDSKEFFDAGVILPEDEIEEAPSRASSSSKTRLTELRRRIEERLDSKRIALEFDYEFLDELPDNLQ